MIAVALLGGYLALPYRTLTVWIDPVTGSIKTQKCQFPFFAQPVVTHSAIESWLVRNEGGYSPSWQCLSETSDTPFGRFRGCSSAPAIYVFHSERKNILFVQMLSHQEIAGFVRVMRTGSEPQKRAAVETASARIFRPVY